MKNIKDRVILGAISGLIAAAVATVPNAIEYKTGLTDVRFSEPGASLFLPKRVAKKNTTKSRIVAALVNGTMVAFTGTLITYIISATGRDKAMVKGAGIGAIQWVGIYGLLSRIGLTVKSNKPLTNILSFFDHTAFGAITGLLASKLGDDSLFPDSDVKQGEKLPLTSNTNQQSKSPPLRMWRIKKSHA